MTTKLLLSTAAEGGGAGTIEVAVGEAGMRLDRWFKRHFPQVTHGRLQKWLRTGQVRVDGGRAKAGTRLEAGQRMRVPPSSRRWRAALPESRTRPARISPRMTDSVNFFEPTVTSFPEADGSTATAENAAMKNERVIPHGPPVNLIRPTRPWHRAGSAGR